MPDLFDQLVNYVTALQRGAADCKRAEERPEYTRRLAAAAEMFAALRRADRPELKRLIDQEEHAIGWSYLEGNEGAAAAAEASFTAFATHARMSGATSAA